MNPNELKDKLPGEFIESVGKRGIKELTPPQELAIKKGFLSGKNLVVAAPTASGKTLIAEMQIIKTVVWDKRKAVYIAPMRALVSEKFSEFKEAYPYLKIAMSIGDLDALDEFLSRYDVIFVSTEKFDSLIRHGIDWLSQIGCIIFDEIHMLDEFERGPTLEILITKLKRICKDAQLIALSATIGNAEEIQKWLGAELVYSTYRPIPLERGVELNGEVWYNDDRNEKLNSTEKLPEVMVADDTLKKKKQIIIFYATRRNAEAGAERLSGSISKHLSAEDKNSLEEASNKVLHALSTPTAQCEKLSRLITDGVAFHHSGLVNAQRHAIEEAFRSGKIKLICSTTTLGFGVNMPAHTVLVRDTSRYGEGRGSVKMSVNEVNQLFGRAGRPKYDTMGRALLIARSKDDLSYLFERYINADLDPIISKLGVIPVLRSHVLAFIATEFLRRSDSIIGFLNETFYGYQYGGGRELKEITESVLDELCKWQFIEKRGQAYEATRIGRRVSELYINPLSAKMIVDLLPKAKDDVAALYMISKTLEMKPYSKITEEAEEMFLRYSYMDEDVVPYYDEDMIYDPERAFSTALLLKDWAEETNERTLAIKYSETPGSIFTKINNADWLLYSSSELAKLLHLNASKLIELRIRVRYGIRKELLGLIMLEQVGRVRARLMYNNGIRKVSDLRKEGSKETVARLFGSEIAKKILGQANTEELQL